MRKILAIDDQKDNLISIKAVLTSQLKNIEVIFAFSGKEGIELANKHEPDCIILDIIMPEMDGYETCKILKRNKQTGTIPILLLTAIKTNPEDRTKGLLLGADAFLSKPIDPIELATQVRVMLRIKLAEDKLRMDNKRLEKLVKEKTESLLSSEKRFKTLYNNAPLPYFSMTKEGNISEVNKSWLTTLNYKRVDAIDKPFTRFLVKECIGNFHKIIEEVKSRGSIESMECKLKSGDDIFLEVLLNISVNSDNGDDTNHFFCVFSDLSQTKRAELAVAERERQFNTLVSNLEGIAYRCLNDDFWTMKYITNGFEAITGYKAEDVIDNSVISFLEIIHPDDRERVDNEVGACLQDGNPFEVQYRLVTKEGDVKHIIDKGLEIPSGTEGESLLEGFIYDISNTIEAQTEANKLLSAVTQSPSVIAITDVNGIIEYVNPKFTEITGYNSSEVIGKKSNILKSGLQDDEVYKSLWRTIKQGKIWKGQFQNKRKNGSIFWESASIFPVLDSKGGILNFIKVAEDISDIIRSKKALRESEARYEKLLDTTGEGFWVIDQTGLTLEVNTALCNLLGYSKEEIIGKKPYDFVDDENRKIFDYQIARANSDIQRTYEISLRNKDGQNIPTRFNATSIKNDNGEFMGSFALVTNISKSKRAELLQKVMYKIATKAIESINLNELIEEIRKELGNIIDTTNFFVALYDNTTNMLTLPFFADQKDKIISIPAGKSLTDYVIKTQKPLLANRKVKDDLESQGKIERFGSNSKIWLGVPLKFEGDVIGVLVVQSYDNEEAYDIEDMKMLEFVSDQISITINRKKTEESMKLALDKATESDRLKTAFLQNISHEIRTPMNGILGFTSLMKEPGISGEEQQAYLDVIMISGNRMLNTLNDLMDMSMLETGQVKLNHTSINVREELSTVISMYQMEAGNKGIELRLDFPRETDNIEITTDRDKVFAVLTNLVKNAIKYTRAGHVSVGYTLNFGEVKFFVKDTGIGIPKSRISAIFERFVQADIEDVKVHEGSGLGLSISKAYVELLGGKIWAESIFGEGSEFYFTLPYIEETKQEEISEIVVKDAEPKDGLKILIAEDEEFAKEYLGIILQSDKNEILVAEDGIRAVEITRDNPDLDLILMDIKLPKMDGYAATTAIRTFNENVIIIAQTAYALAGDRSKAIDSGCNDYISKPIKKEILFDLISKYFK